MYNKLLEPMTLSETQLAEYRARPFEDLGGKLPFPEDLLAKHSHPSSKVPLIPWCQVFVNSLVGVVTSCCAVSGVISRLRWVPGNRNSRRIGVAPRLWLVCPYIFRFCWVLYYCSLVFRFCDCEIGCSLWSVC